MATLTETAFIARRLIKYSGFGVILYIVLSQTIRLGIAMYKYYNPPPPPPPTVGFGLLPPINFPDENDFDLMYELDTPSKSFPVFKDRSVVYYMPFQRTSLLALDEADAMAKMLGFMDSPKEITTEIYQWKMSVPSPIVLEQNIANGSYQYNYQWQTDKSLLTDKFIPGQAQTISNVEGYFERVSVNLEDMNFDNLEISYLKDSGNRLVPAVSISDATFVNVELFRNPITIGEGKEMVEFPVVTSNPDKGIISMIFSGANVASKKIISVEYNYFPVNYLQPETYLLKPVQEAWNELKSGGGYIAKLDDLEADTVYVRRVELAYYDTYEAQEFLQPIYVFRGDTGGSEEFVSYVSAINNVHVKKKQ